MPYRDAAPRNALDAVLVCVGCGVQMPITRATHADAECPQCGIPETPPNVLRIESRDARPYDELTPFLKELTGRSEKCASIIVRCDGIQLEVSLSIVSSAVGGLDVVARTTGLPAMRLVPEQDAQRRAKKIWLSSEIQTGDAAFDDAVYIETEADAAAVRYVLSAPAVRAAIRELLSSQVKAVTFDEKAVRVSVPAKAKPYARDKIRRLVFALRAVAGAPRVVAVSYAKPSRLAAGLVIGSFALVPLTIASLALGFLKYAPVVDTNKLVLVPGLALALFLTPVFKRALSGRSTSHRDFFRVRLMTTICLPLLAWGAAVTLNGALDRSAARTETQRVISSHTDEDDLIVESTDANGAVHPHIFAHAANATKDDTVTVTTRAGAFGWRWQSAPPVLVAH